MDEANEEDTSCENSIFGNTSHEDTKLSMPKKNVLVVPWYNAAQFRRVYESIYNSDIIKKKWASEQMCTWKMRSRQSLNVAIGATYDLHNAVIQDILYSNGASLITESDLKCLYAAAIVRFVNDITSVHKDFDRESMTLIAKKLGMHPFIVKIRNEISHVGVPDLWSLRNAAQSCMAYLKESYWDKEAKRVKNYIKEPDDTSDLRQLFLQYIACQFILMSKEEEKVEQADQALDELRLKEIVQLLQKRIITNKEMFIKVLVSDGIFIPLDRDLTDFMTEEELEKFDNKFDHEQAKKETWRRCKKFDTALEHKRSKKDLKSFASDVIPSIPSCHLRVWYEIISLLNKHDGVPMFMEALLKTQGDRSVPGQKLTISWVLQILKIHSACVRNCSFDCNDELKKIFKRKGMLANWHTMFYAAVINPCKYTPFVMSLILLHLEVNERPIKYIMNLMAILIDETTDDTDELKGVKKTFTVEDIKQMKKLQLEEIRKAKGESENIWSLTEDEDYAKWPLGVILNPIMPDEITDIEQDNGFDDVILNSEEKFVQKFIHGVNENDEEYFEMDVAESPDTFEDELLTELAKRKKEGLLYTSWEQFV